MDRCKGDKYEKLNKVGEGTFGVVYRVRHRYFCANSLCRRKPPLCAKRACTLTLLSWGGESLAFDFPVMSKPKPHLGDIAKQVWAAAGGD